MGKYVNVRMPLDAYNNWVLKQKKMQLEIKDMTGKDRHIPLTNIFRMASKKPIYMEDRELTGLSKRRWKKL